VCAEILVPCRGFDREAKLESRVFCPCELCRLRFGRMLYPKTALANPSASVGSRDFRGTS
jgi:hypothetical protein